MQVITDILFNLGDVAITCFEFLFETVEGLAYCVRLTAYFISNIPNYFGWLPPEFLAIVVLIFSIAVVYKILGREG